MIEESRMILQQSRYLAVATLLTQMFFVVSVFFLLMGLIYNVPPIRAKEIPYIDVLCESINNPIRLFLGWSAISTIIAPPTSLLICYWFGGAFLMSMKRYSEFKMINDKKYERLFKKHKELKQQLKEGYLTDICQENEKLRSLLSNCEIRISKVYRNYGKNINQAD